MLGRVGGPARRLRSSGIVVAAALVALPVAAAAAQVRPAKSAAAPKPFFDSREGARAAVSRAGARNPYVTATARTSAARTAFRASLGRQTVLSVDPLTGTPRQLVRLDRPLTAAASGDRAAIALDYAHANRAALGLDAADLDGLVLAERVNAPRGVQVIRWQQRADGIPAFDNDLRVAVDRAGRVISVAGSPRHDLSVASTKPALDASAALRRLQENVGAVRPVAVKSGPSGVRRSTRFADRGFARLVLFGAAGSVRLAWHVGYHAARTAYYDAVVDATSGAILYRQNLVKFDNRPADVYPNFPVANDPPGPNAVRHVDLADLGYVGDSTTTIDGPFSHTYADEDGDLQASPSEEVPPRTTAQGPYTLAKTDGTHDFEDPTHGCTAVFLCTWTSNFPATWRTNREQATVQTHWFIGNYHKHLANPDTIGFDAASGNFEGADKVEANAEEGAATDPQTGGPDPRFTNNAFMLTLPDGQSPSMAMYLNEFFPDSDFPFRDNDNGDDAATVYHEYTHGLSNRLITNADGTGALSTPQAGAMGEAWSDWYAFDKLERDQLDVDHVDVPGEMDLGKYSDAAPHSTRRQALDCPVGTAAPVCPGGVDTDAGGFTYGDFGHVYGAPEVHSDGEIWGETLWDMRQQLVTRFGEADGSDRSEILVTLAMRLSPPEPSMLDERNAIIAADVAAFGGSDVNLLWDVFRQRGMGYFAAATDGDDVTPVEDFSPPPAADAPKGAIAGTVTDALTGLPLGGARVGLAGHATSPGFPEFLADDTAADGAYRIDGITAASYPKLSFQRAGYDTITTRNVTVGENQTTSRNAALQRDWAALKGGASVTQSEDSPESDCDARFLIDQTGAGWETFNEGDDRTGPSATITLPASVNVDAFLLNPSNTCGDGPSASTKDYRLETSSDGVTFQLAKAGSFTAADRNRLNRVVPDGATGQNVKYVRLTLLSPQLTCATCSGNDFVDFTELEVVGGPPNTAPHGTLDASVRSVAVGAPVTFTARFTDDDSAITGYDWDFDGNGTVDRSTAGPTTSFAYPAAGTYTAKVMAKDFRGGAGTATSPSIAVTGPAGGGGGGQPPGGGGGGQAPGGGGAAPATRPTLSVPARGSNGRYSFTLTCATSCRVTAKMTVSRSLARRLHLKHRTVGSLSRTFTGRRTLRITLSKSLRNAARKAKLKRITASITVNATNAGGSTKRTRTVTIRL